MLQLFEVICFFTNTKAYAKGLITVVNIFDIQKESGSVRNTHYNYLKFLIFLEIINLYL